MIPLIEDGAQGRGDYVFGDIVEWFLQGISERTCSAWIQLARRSESYRGFDATRADDWM